MTSNFTELFNRDLDKLKVEIESFQNPENIWRKVGNIKNSAGTLCLHLAGNLQHFIGTVLGETGYVRDREFEFSGRPVDIQRLLSEIESARKVINQVLPSLTQERLSQPFPIDVLKDGSSVEKFVMHLYGHLNWHLGHIYYLRRILE